jgi:hypothetical protein
MEMLLLGERPPLEGLGELEQVVAAAWRHDTAERATLAELLDMLRRPLRSVRAGASMAMLPRRSPLPVALSRKSSERQLPAGAPAAARVELAASSPAVARMVPPLRRVPVPLASTVTSKPRSSSLSSSSSCESQGPSARSWEERSRAQQPPVAPPYHFNGGVMPHVKVSGLFFVFLVIEGVEQGSKIENAPNGELWYSLRLAPESYLQFRVYPVLSAFETRSLRQHWTKLWRCDICVIVPSQLCAVCVATRVCCRLWGR